MGLFAACSSPTCRPRSLPPGARAIHAYPTFFSSSSWTWGFPIGCACSALPVICPCNVCRVALCRCVISLERTEAVGAAPALDFCLDHVNDDFASDPHSPSPQTGVTASSPEPAPPSVPHLSSLSAASHADVSIRLPSDSSSVERSAFMHVADAMVSATAHTALAPLRALSASLKSSSASGRSAARAHSITNVEDGGEVDEIGFRRTRSAPSGATAAAPDAPPAPSAIRTQSDAVHQLQRSASSPATVDNSGGLQRVRSVGRAVAAVVDSIAAVFKEQQPFTCLICSDDFPVELRCSLPCTSPACSSMCVGRVGCDRAPPCDLRFLQDGLQELRAEKYRGECERW